MRKFYLHKIDKSMSFSLNDKGILATNPKGLGNNFNITYKETAERKYLANIKPEFETISFDIYFNADGSNGYKNYKTFVTFLSSTGMKQLLLQYEDEITDKYCQVVLKTQPKSEIDDEGIFCETFVFERQTYWYKEDIQSFSLHQNNIGNNGNIFPMKFPFGFSGTVFQKEYRATNLFFDEVPIDIKITGDIKENICIYIEDINSKKILQQIKMKVNCKNGQIYNFIATDKKQVLITENGQTRSAYDLIDHLYQTFLYLPQGTYIIGSNIQIGDKGSIDISIKNYLLD